MKLLKTVGFGVALSALAFSFQSCKGEKVDQCKNLSSGTQCENCCHSNGYNGYKYNATKSEPCECM
jgi:hypothetical protein